MLQLITWENDVLLMDYAARFLQQGIIIFEGVGYFGLWPKLFSLRILYGR